jgi:hypothetical protein
MSRSGNPSETFIGLTLPLSLTFLDVAPPRRADAKMPQFLYRCPDTGFRVQDFTPDDDGSEGANDAFVVVTCLACGRMHFVNPKTGETPSET